MRKLRLAECVNLLGDYCGPRDIEALTPDCLSRKYQIPRADVFALFGGSILCGGDVLAEAMRNRVAGCYAIVGGAGHTTQTLREKMRAAHPEIETRSMSEAEIFDAYLRRRYGMSADLLERESTNCGNNITNLLELLRKRNIPCESIILAQDATMQRRMEAGMRRHRPDVRVINFATYRATAVEAGGALAFDADIRGMWDMEHYIRLLLGEIVRLRDDRDGYGPAGKGFIAHVEIPADVLRAFQELQRAFPSMIREANPAYAG